MQRNHRACKTCAAAKAACRPGTDCTCQRCLRLGKECVPPAPMVRRPRGPGKAAARNAALERKIDGLVQMLAAKDDADAGGLKLDNRRDSLPPTPASISCSDGAAAAASQAGNAFQAQAQDTCPNLDLQAKFEISDAEGALLVLEYHSHLGQAFPFVQIDEHLMSGPRRKTQPLLYRAVCTVASYCDFPRQQAMAKDLIHGLVMSVFVSGKRNLDQLQACLVLLAWYHYFTFENAQMTSLIHLATTLVVDLGLDKAPPSPRREGDAFGEFLLRATHGAAASSAPRTKDELLALLGTFYLASALSVDSSSLHALAWTPYLAQACFELETQLAPESLNTQAAVKLATLRFICSRMSSTTSTSVAAEGPAHSTARSSNQHQREIDQLWQSLPSSMEAMPSLRLQRLAAEVQLYSTGLVQAAVQSTISPDVTAAPHGNHHQQQQQQQQQLWECLERIKLLFTELFALPPAQWFTLTSPVLAQFAHAAGIMSHVEALDDAATAATASWSVAQLLSRCADLMERVPQEARFNGTHPIGSNSIFPRWAWRLRWWQASCCGGAYSGSRRAVSLLADVTLGQSTQHVSSAPLMDSLAGSIQAGYAGYDAGVWQQHMAMSAPWPDAPPQYHIH